MTHFLNNISYNLYYYAHQKKCGHFWFCDFTWSLRWVYTTCTIATGLATSIGWETHYKYCLAKYIHTSDKKYIVKKLRTFAIKIVLRLYDMLSLWLHMFTSLYMLSLSLYMLTLVGTIR